VKDFSGQGADIALMQEGQSKLYFQMPVVIGPVPK